MLSSTFHSLSIIAGQLSPGVERTFIPEPAPAPEPPAATEAALEALAGDGGGGDDGWPDEDEEEAAEAEAVRGAKKPRSRVLNTHPLSAAASQSRLAALLTAAERAAGGAARAGAEAGAKAEAAAAAPPPPHDFGAVLEFVHGLSPSALDLELRALAGADELRLMLVFFREMIESRCDFELVQAAISVFLKIHAEALATETALLEPVRALHAAQEKGWGELQALLQTDLCMLSFYCRTRG